MAAQNDVHQIQNIVEALDRNPVARFAYSQRAFDENDIDGVESFSQSAEQTIPKAANVEYNQTILDKGIRTQGASTPRSVWNHYLGRLSYNLNKLIQKICVFFNVYRSSLAHNANEYDAGALYKKGDCCYVVETVEDKKVYSLYTRTSNSPETIGNIPPDVDLHWTLVQVVDRTISVNDNAVGTVADIGMDISIPIGVTVPDNVQSNVLPNTWYVSLRLWLTQARQNLKYLFEQKQDKFSLGTGLSFIPGLDGDLILNLHSSLLTIINPTPTNPAVGSNLIVTGVNASVGQTVSFRYYNGQYVGGNLGTVVTGSYVVRSVTTGVRHVYICGSFGADIGYDETYIVSILVQRVS